MKVNKKATREAKHLYRWCVVKNLLDEARVRQVVQMVLTAGHRASPAIVWHFLRLVRFDLAQHTAHVESAVPLPADVQAATQAGLTRMYGPGVTTEFTCRPSLIGGMRIQVGSDVYDGSVSAALAAVEKNL